MKIVLTLMILITPVYPLSIFGLNIGDTITRDVDTLIYIDPLKSEVPAKIHYEYGKLQSAECLLSKTRFDSAFPVLERYLCNVFGKPLKTISDSSEKYHIWIVESCCVELVGSKKERSSIIRIDGDGKVRMQMLLQMESLYDSISSYRKRK